MLLADLPPELFFIIVQQLNDRCFAWLVLRNVSTAIRQATECAFASYFKKDCHIRFSGPFAARILADHWQLNNYSQGSWIHKHKEPLQNQFPSFLFKASGFHPAHSRASAVLKMQDESADYTNDSNLLAVRRFRSSSTVYSYAFYLRRQCCTCPMRIETAEQVLQCDCLAKLFFAAFRQPSDVQASISRESHFVRLDGKLKSFVIPSITVDVVGQHILFDWRYLYQMFYLDELRLRQAARPWLRYVALDRYSNRIKVHKLADAEYPDYYGSFTTSALSAMIQEDEWIFSNRSPPNDLSWRLLPQNEAGAPHRTPVPETLSGRGRLARRTVRRR